MHSSRAATLSCLLTAVATVVATAGATLAQAQEGPAPGFNPAGEAQTYGIATAPAAVTAPVAAPGAVLAAAPTIAPSSAQLRSTTLADLQKAFAYAIYAGNPDLVHDHRPQAMLRSLVMLTAKPGADGKWTATVRRGNDEQPEMTARALETVGRIGTQVDAILARLGPNDRAMFAANGGVTEVWLFETDGTFALQTLAKEQVYTGVTPDADAPAPLEQSAAR